MLDIEKIRQLIEMMVENDLVEVSLRDGEEEVNLRRPGGGPAEVSASASTPPVAALPQEIGQQVPSASPAAQDGEEESDEETDLIPISSPMVGTFYRASDPDTPPFVQVGSEVHAGTLVCILEAMKVFNEIKAEVSGIIEKILVTNEQAVEYGQALFMVRPI